MADEMDLARLLTGISADAQEEELFAAQSTSLYVYLKRNSRARWLLQRGRQAGWCFGRLLATACSVLSRARVCGCV